MAGPQQSNMTVNAVSASSSDGEEEEEDMVVDLSSGSLEPVSMQKWSLITEITQKMRNL